jgi:polyhydroxyalkanoate synthesis regulator phasin
LRVDALFEEDFRHTVHQSNGSVESSEYKDIQEHLEAIEVMKKQTVEAEKERQEQLEKKQNLAMRTDAPTVTALQSAPQTVPQAMENRRDAASQGGTKQSVGQTLSSQSVPGQTLSGQTLEEHVKDLRQQVERLVKAPGAPLKSAPFHTASTLQSLTTGTEVLILITTPYWLGVETHEGQHGWILRDQLEQP